MDTKAKSRNEGVLPDWQNAKIPFHAVSGPLVRLRIAGHIRTPFDNAKISWAWCRIVIVAIAIAYAEYDHIRPIMYDRQT